MIVNKALGQVLGVANALTGQIGDGVDRRMSAFHRSVLFIVFSVAAGRSLYGFLQHQSFGEATGLDGTAWVYLSLAILTALSLVAHQKLPAFRICAFAVPTMALGASFLLLDFRTRLGWTIVMGTAVAATPLIVHELVRAWARRALDVPENGQADDRR